MGALLVPVVVDISFSQGGDSMWPWLGFWYPWIRPRMLWWYPHPRYCYPWGLVSREEEKAVLEHWEKWLASELDVIRKRLEELGK